MTGELRSPKVAYSDGYVFNKKWIAIASYYTELAESEHARVLTMANGEWTHFDLDFDVRSLVGLEKPSRRLFCLGRSGQVSIQQKGGAVVEKVGEAGTGKGKLGYL